MQRITTPTRVIDLFGPGKDGFTDTPPDQTELEAAWFNAVQEEIANVIEGQGIALNGANFDQLKQALDGYAFDSPTITGTLTIDNGATLVVLSGGTFQVDAGATYLVNADPVVNGDARFNGLLDARGDVNLGDAVGDTVTVNGTTTLNAGATLADAQSIQGATPNTSVVVGTVDTADANGVVRTGEVAFYSDATPSTITGVMQFAGRFLTVGISSVARKVYTPFRDHVAGPVSTVNSIQDTGASITVTLVGGDTVEITMDYEAKNTSATNNVNVRLEINGTPEGSTEPHAPAKDNVYFTVRRVVEYTAPATASYTFTARFGATGGTSTVQNVNLRVAHVN